MVVNRSLAKVFQTSAFQTAAKRAVHKCLAELHVSNDVVTCKIDLAAFTIQVAKYVRSEIKKRSLKKAEVDQYWKVSEKKTARHQKNAEDGFPTQRKDSVRSASRPTDISDDKKNQQMYSTFTFSDVSDIRHNDCHLCKENNSRHWSYGHYCFQTPRHTSEFVPNPDSKFWYQ